MMVSAVGGRWGLVECYNDEKLIKFYSDNGFKRIMNQPDESIPMVQMIIKNLIDDEVKVMDIRGNVRVRRTSIN